jgi:hypothetical protein
MLTVERYEQLWSDKKPGGFGKTIAPPPYHEYLQREIYKQDYMDLFEDGKTIETFKRARVGEKWGISLDAFKLPIDTITSIPPVDLLIEPITKEKLLRVDYDFPYGSELKGNIHSRVDLSEEEKTIKFNRNIRYVMIGEAANSQKPKHKQYKYGGRDVENTYFFNINHVKSTPYFSAPIQAFGIDTGLLKKDHLIELADKGVSLEDLFPFAIEYDSNLRKSTVNLALSNFKDIQSKLTYNNLKYCFLCTTDHALSIMRANRLDDKITAPIFTKWQKLVATTKSDSKWICNYKNYGKDASGNPSTIPIQIAFDLGPFK